ncbi:MAG: NADAR family protein [Clostridia bacterium]|nr:NADAR family protein [Clostridia bacterium]
MDKINSFRGEYFFLSNFYEAPIQYDGLVYRNNEAAFQAQKCENKDDRKRFTAMNPSEAKRAGRKVKLRPYWDEIKYDIMFRLVFNKFLQNADLADKLVATGDVPLEEGNDWGDKIWGTVNGVGENHLGKALMETRRLLKDNDLVKTYVNEWRKEFGCEYIF